MSAKTATAIAYLRTSSAANVGQDKDSDKRQRSAIAAFAAANGYALVGEFYDAAVSGADAVDQRAGFVAMLRYIAGNGARTIIVESPDRFARDLVVQLAGYDLLKAQGIRLIPTTAPEFFAEDTPTAVLVRQVLGAIAQFEKASVVAKLAAARRRKRDATGRCEGRKPLSETVTQATLLARQLRRKRPKGGRLSLRSISAELARRGHLNERGTPYNAKSIASMIAR
jgi:DNA invertase Pin-like site-specific DNA recombinase